MAEASANTVVRITDAACAALGELGLYSVTIGAVAERPVVSTALVHYHFDTKAQLLVAAARRLASQRAEKRVAALTGSRGLAALDTLWSSLVEASQGGSARAYLELVLYSRESPEVSAALAEHRRSELEALRKRIPMLLRELGAAPHAHADEVAASLDAELDGLVVALLSGQAPETVRTVYDAFWLSLIAAGQSRRG